MDTKENWTGINTIVKIISERTIKKTGLYSCETRFYITSLNVDAKQINSSIRTHWAIENNLHWTLDVVMKKDGQLNYIGNAAQNMNMIKKIALAMLANEKTIKKSKKKNEICLD